MASLSPPQSANDSHLVFYRETLAFLNQNFLEGLCLEIVLLMALTVALLDWALGSLLWGVLGAYFLSKALRGLRSYWGENALVRNSKFDSRFLI